MYNNSGGQSGPSRGIRLSFLTTADQAKFEQLFSQSAASFGGNKLPANVVSDLLRRSNLDNNSLASIWDLASIANAPFLTFPEFAVAMFLTSKKLMGQQLPASLPPNVREETEIAMATIASTEAPPPSQPLINTNIPPQQPQQQFQVPMMTGMPNQMVPMMTGMPPMNNQLRPTPPPVPQLPMQTGYVSNYQAPMQTGFQPSMPAAKPRLQNLDFAKKMMPNQNGSTNLLQSLGTSEANKISWKISPEDRQRYREIFQAWEGSGSGYMSGDTAKDVFTQSQLPPGDLMKIWTLADKDNKGSLDEDEFAIGMHLIYRKLNGYDIPTSLPAELVPPSSVLKKFVLGRRPPPSTPSFGTNTNQQPSRYQEESDDDSYDYVSSARRKGQQPATRSYHRADDNEADVVILEDLRRQIYETKRTLDRIPKPSKPVSSYSNKYSVEELKEKIRRAHDDINNSLRSNPAHKKYLENVETMSELLETQKELQDEIQYLCNRDIPVLARQLRSSAAELRDAKVRHSRRADTSQDYMSFVQPTGPGGSITESDRVRAKAKAMMAARKAGNTGSTADASFVLRRAEEEKEEADKKADAIERDMEKSRTALLDMRADLRFLEELGSNKDVEDKKRFENGQDLSYELRRFIEQLENRVPEPASYSSRDYKSSPSLGSPSSYKSPSISSPVVSASSPKPKPAPVRPRTAEEIKKEAERRVQERLAAIQAKRNPNKTVTSTPAISKPDEAEEVAQQSFNQAEAQAQEMLRNTVSQREELDRKKREADLERIRENERLEQQRLEEAERQAERDAENARKQQEEEEKRREQEERDLEERRRQILAKEEADRQARFDAIKREEEAEAAKKAQQKPEELAPVETPESTPSKTPSSNNPFAKIGSSQAEKPNEAPNKRVSYNPFAAFSAFSATKGGSDSDTEDDGWDEKNDDSDDEKEFPAAGSAKNLAGMLFNAMSKRTGSDIEPIPESSPKPDEVDFTTPSSEIPPPPPAPPVTESSIPPPPPAPAAPVAPPPPAVNNDSTQAIPAPPGGDLRSALLGQIHQGTKLKKTTTNDRSASSVTGRVIDDGTSTPVVPAPGPAEIVAPQPIAPLSSNAFLSELQSRTNESTPVEPTPVEEPVQKHNHDESLPEQEFIALWDYPGSGPDDLTFSQDDIILVRDCNEAEDWWFGTLEKTQKTGYFPRNYVQLKPEPLPELNIKAKALYDFEGPAGQGCLDFKMGDTITVVFKESNDWWRAKSEDGTREGLVPANYIEEI